MLLEKNAWRAKNLEHEAKGGHMLGCPDCERYERLIAAQKTMLERQAREWEERKERRIAAAKKAAEARWAKPPNANA